MCCPLQEMKPWTRLKGRHRLGPLLERKNTRVLDLLLELKT